MNVLHIASWYPNSKDPFDGDFVERHLKALSLHLPVHVIHVVQKFHLSENETARTEYKTDGALTAEIHFVPLPGIKNLFLQKLLFTRRYNAALKKAIETYIQKKGKPDLVHVHVPVKAGYGALWMKRKWGVPYVVTEHSSAYYDHIDENYFEGSGYFKQITRRSFRQAVAVSSVSQWLLKRLQELFNINSTKLIRNTVDTNLFYLYPVQNERKRFIHVSMMMPLKNTEGIVKALHLLLQKSSDWEFVFVGPAPDHLKQAAASLSTRVRFTGALSYAEVAAEMRQADALVHFSRYENLPCVVNEALCCGLAVIASDVGGINELVYDGNGLLVPDNNSQALADAMLYYLQHTGNYNRTAISNEASVFSYYNVGLQLKEMYVQLFRK
jgi:glycosyltransferase involved in cell wall biosynthesis